ncbi:unnamed protein product [Notodromas monacha]|uniref:Ribosomal RNA-processing protein 14/surfeit locus protein 6 C-terminal domain-containing protein n=1 Tax=Notodromas monacha TaxID=399045 RepID=A0A7R9GB02_9CRUS|nr:unnamed protein product [Notodromas monacha]CAG0916005.1 unnamed protein product [Notodromas monacha]
MCNPEELITLHPAFPPRSMKVKDIIARLLKYKSEAEEYIQGLPAIYQPGYKEDGDSSSSSDEESSTNKTKKPKSKQRRNELRKLGLIGDSTRAMSRQELEDRFRKKMASFNPERRQKSEAKQMRILRRATIAEKKKEKAKEHKKKERQRNKIRKKGAASDPDSPVVKAKSEAGQVSESIPSTLTSAKKEAEKHAPRDDEITFSKFDFSGSQGTEKTRKSGKNLKRVLTSLQKTKAKEDKLKKQGDEEGLKSLKEKKSWQNALAKAEGVKVKDDMKLVKKSLKRIEIKKKSSTKKWKERQGNLAEKQKQQQEKRKTNLKSRHQAKMKKKVKRSIRKGRVVF